MGELSGGNQICLDEADRIANPSCPQTWYEARAFCEAGGGWLATPRDVAENNHYNALLTATNRASAWLGLNDDYAIPGSNKWHTKWGLYSDPSTPSILWPNKGRGASCTRNDDSAVCDVKFDIHYHNWESASEPKQETNKNCARMLASDGRWRAVNCGNQHRAYFCAGLSMLYVCVIHVCVVYACWCTF